MSEFKQGQHDCRDGVEPQSQSQEYLDGYALQYEIEQRDDAKSAYQDEEMRL